MCNKFISCRKLVTARLLISRFQSAKHRNFFSIVRVRLAREIVPDYGRIDLQ